jgi:hypothetical protein
MARLGTQGCGLEHQLQSIRVALANGVAPAGNAGFLRDSAYLAVILITDEDDCSAPPDSTMFENVPAGININYLCYPPAAQCQMMALPLVPFMIPVGQCVVRPDGAGKLIPIADFVGFFQSLKPPGHVIVSAIAGWPQPGELGSYQADTSGGDGLNVTWTACNANGGGTASLRVKAFVDAFGDNGTFSSICADDFSPAMAKIGQLINQKLENQCFDQPLVDTDPKTPGLQPDCAVTETVGSGQPQPLPSCATGRSPCWTFVPPGDPQNTCAVGYKINIQRTAPAAPGTQAVVRCQTCDSPDDPRCQLR